MSRDDSCIVKSPVQVETLSVPNQAKNTTDSQASSQLGLDDQWVMTNGDMFDEFDINEEIMADIGNLTNISSINKSVQKLLSSKDDPNNAKSIE